jgi:AraC-like DNA-binding protein
VTDFAEDGLISISTLAIRPLLEAAAVLGIDVDHALAEHGLEPAVVRDPEARIQRDRILAVLAEITRRAGDRSLGLLAARRLEAGDLGIFDFLVSSCGTLREAAAIGEQMLRLFHDTAEMELTETARSARYALLPRTVRVVAPALAEFAIAAIMGYIRRLTGRDLPASEIHFAHLRVPYVHELEAYFASAVRFDADVNAIVIPRIYLDLPLPKPNPALYRTLSGCAKQLIEHIPSRATFLEQTRRRIAERLGAGDAALPSVAGDLQLHPRTLQRTLRRHGTSFQELLDDVRCQLAVQYVSTTDAPLGHVAHSLGFIDASAFSRAFRRWTGQSPSAYKSSGRMRAATPRKDDGPLD